MLVNKHETTKLIPLTQGKGAGIHLGYHKCDTNAAIAYNEAALKYQGEFARLNEVAA